MDLKLENKIIVVSEGTKAFNEGIVKVLANEGAIPVLIKKSESNNLKMANAIESVGEGCFQFSADLTKPDECEITIQQVEKKFGSIDGLINSTCISNAGDFKTSNYQTFVESLKENVISYYLITHYALPVLKKSKGAIVNIISNYPAATCGESALTREWAVELLKYNIRVNAVVLQNSKSLTEQISNTVAFLLSEKSSHTTGQLIHVDSGYSNLNQHSQTLS
ncbi:MAG TPA: SDR family oxidoreductase [Parafilimonas sp.]|nr:SDR family oxidoreductase [Parafilimonas sp.]